MEKKIVEAIRRMEDAFYTAYSYIDMDWVSDEKREAIDNKFSLAMEDLARCLGIKNIDDLLDDFSLEEEETDILGPTDEPSELPRKELDITFFKDNDDIFCMKKRLDKTEQEVKPKIRSIAFPVCEFADVLHNIEATPYKFSIVVNSRRADNLVDQKEFEDAAKSISPNTKLSFKYE